MSELLRFPFVNQRTDGNINHDFDCVPSSLEAGANYLLGKSVIDDSAMKNAIYGAGYIGGTAASAYVDYLKARGIKLYAVSGPLSLARQHLAAGHPVVFTRDDPYSSNPDFSHVSVWYKDAPGSLTAMDPFGAQSITMTDAQWTTHLRGNEFWIMELEDSMIDITNAWVKGYFTQTGTSPERWHCTKTGFDLYAGILAGWKAMNGAPRLPVGPETPCGKQTVYQECESGVLVYDPAHELDAPSGPWAPCYLMKWDSALAKKLLSAAAAPAPMDTSALENSIHAIADGIAPLVAAALVEAKKL